MRDIMKANGKQNIQKVTIKDLKFDTKNANKHSEKGLSLLEKSLSKLGAGRSILLDKDNNIIAGNGVVEVAGQIGLENVRIIETDGNEIIAVKRKDVSINSKKGRELALADNQTAKEGIVFDFDVINDLAIEFDINLQDWKLQPIEFDSTTWHDVNNLTDDDVRDLLNEEFDPYGVSAGYQRVVFTFKNPEEARKYLDSIGIKEYSKSRSGWQVDFTTRSI